ARVKHRRESDQRRLYNQSLLNRRERNTRCADQICQEHHGRIAGYLSPAFPGEIEHSRGPQDVNQGARARAKAGPLQEFAHRRLAAHACERQEADRLSAVTTTPLTLSTRVPTQDSQQPTAEFLERLHSTPSR